MTDRKTIYDKITDRILELIDRGVAPWQPHHNCRSARPGKNIRGNAYRGINAFMTWAVASVEGYESPYWLTFNQAKELGGSVRKGEKGTPVVYWGRVEGKEGDNGEKKNGYVFARGYVVFNLEQIDGLDESKLPIDEVGRDRFEHDAIAECESIVGGWLAKPVIETRNGTPAYNPIRDVVYMPERNRFDSIEHYYATLFHELAHSTGHESRLNRELSEKKCKQEYGEEELVAEFAAAFLSHAAGIEPATIDNTAAYLDGWKRVIQADKTMVVMAAAKAQKAADMVLGKTFEKVEA